MCTDQVLIPNTTKKKKKATNYFPGKDGLVKMLKSDKTIKEILKPLKHWVETLIAIIYRWSFKF
jgi:competence protein ComGC